MWLNRLVGQDSAQEQERRKRQAQQAQAFVSQRLAADPTRINDYAVQRRAQEGQQLLNRNMRDQRTRSFRAPSINDIGGALFGGTSKLANTGLGIVEKVGVNALGEFQKLVGDRIGGERTIQEGQQSINKRLLQKGGGLFGAGGVYNSLEEQSAASPLDVLKKAGGAGLQSLSETVPVGRGIQVAKGAAPVVQKVASGAIQGGLAGGIGNAGAQIAENKDFNAQEAVKSLALGGAIGGAIPLAGAAASRYVNSGKPVYQRPLNVPQPRQMPVQQARQLPAIQPQQQVQTPISARPTAARSTVAAPEAFNPSAPSRTRGFIETVRNSEATAPRTREGLSQVNDLYNVRDTQDLVTRAGNLVKDDLNEAERIANKSGDDISQAVGLELLRKHQADGNYEAAISRAEDIARKATENGRATQILAAYGRLTPEGALRFTQRQLNKYNEERGLTGGKKAASLTPEQARAITLKSQEIQSLPDGLDKDRATVELTQLMSTAAPTPLLQKATSIWRAGLLTSLRTLEGGALGNTTKAVLDLPSQAISAGIDRFITAPLFNKGVRSNVFTLRGVGSGAAQGVREGAKYLKTGIDPRDAQQAYDTRAVNWNTGNKVINAIGKGSDYVYRALGAIDNPFYYGAKGRANYEEAFREASRRGLKGSDAREFAKQNANNLPEASRDAATETAKEAVFQNDTILGNFASSVKNLPQRIKDPVKRDLVQAIVDFTIPFAKIPGAVATALVDYSPAGAVLKAGQSVINKASGAEVDLRALNASIGKSATGSLGAVWLGTELYKRGLLTLEEPSDAKEKQLWQAEGKQKFSVKIGDRWYNLNYIQPLAGLMALGGGYVRAQEKGDQDPLIAATGAGLKSVTEQSFLQGINETIGLVKDPGMNGQQFINSKVSSLVPNIVRDTARATDTVERETNTALDAFNNSIPGLRGNSLPQRDLYGEEVERRQDPAGVFLDPFKSTQAKDNDPVTNELRRLYEKDPEGLGVVPSKLDKSQSFEGTKVQLTPEQLDKMEKTAGQKTYSDLAQVFNDEKYKRLSDEDKSNKIGDLIDANRAAARKELAAQGSLANKKGEAVTVNPDDIKVSNVKLKPTGKIETKLAEDTPAYKLLSNISELSKDEKKEWSVKAAEGDSASLISELNKLKPQNLPDLPNTNEVAELFANYQKELADNPDWTQIQKNKATKKLISSAYDIRLSESQRAIASLSSADLESAVADGLVTKDDVKAIIELDNIRHELGLSTNFSKKDRIAFGYGALPAKSGGGRKGGKKAGRKGRRSTGFKAPAKSKFNRIGSTVAIRRLLADAGKGL